MYFNDYNIAFSNEFKVMIELTAYIKHLIAKRCSPKTIENNKVQLKKFYDFLDDSGMCISEIIYSEKPSLIHSNYINYMIKKNPNIKPQSINVNLTCCERFFSFLFVNNYIDKDLDGKIKTVKARTDFVEYTKAHYDKKMSYVFERIKTSKNLFISYDFNLTRELLKIELGDSLKFPKLDVKSKEFISNYIKYRNAVVIRLMGDFGMRIGEVLGIRLSDLDMIGQKIIFVNRRLNNKNGAIAKIRSRDVNVDQRMVDQIIELSDIASDYFKSDYLFLSNVGTPIFPKTFENMFMKYKKILVKKGIISSRDKISPHRLRHECLSGIYRQKGDLEIVKEIAGHKNLSSTEIYIHSSNKEKSECVEEYAKINSGIREEEKDLEIEELGVVQ